MSEAFFKKLEEEGMLLKNVATLGWSFWPSEGGFFDEHLLRLLADEIERRNKPLLDEYENYCKEQENASTDCF